jgi:hypothetical protein
MESQGPQGDVSRFASSGGRQGRTGPGRGAVPDLGACPTCASRLIQPLEIHRFHDGVCHVERRCPECGWYGGDLFSALAVIRFEAGLEAARASIADLLRAVEQARMAADIERFTVALARGEVLPEDF